MIIHSVDLVIIWFVHVCMHAFVRVISKKDSDKHKRFMSKKILPKKLHNGKYNNKIAGK